MPISATAAAVAATDIGPHAKLVLILISDALDMDGNFETQFLPEIRQESVLTEPQFLAAMRELADKRYYTTGHTSEMGNDAYHFGRLSERS